MRPALHQIRLAVISLAAVSGAAGIAACGSTSKPSAGAAGGQPSSLVSFADCMRSHGVPQYSDPGPSTSGGGVPVPDTGIDTSSPAFKRASAACGRLAPTLGAHHGASAQVTEETLKFSECMRAHGVTGFPDPTASAPRSLSGYSAVIRRGVYLAIPATINMASPTYERARAACRFGPVFS